MYASNVGVKLPDFYSFAERFDHYRQPSSLIAHLAFHINREIRRSKSEYRTLIELPPLVDRLGVKFSSRC